VLWGQLAQLAQLAGSAAGGLPLLLGLQQPADLDQVVGEDSVAAPDPGAIDAVRAGPVPAEAVLEVADPPFRARAPFDQPPERLGGLVGLAATSGLALAGDRDPLDPSVCSCPSTAASP
jgi:hypothetical protein